MFSTIPQLRLVLYGSLLGLIPFGCAILYFMNQQANFDATQERLFTVSTLAAVQKKKQTVNLAVKNHFREANHFYIDKYLETLEFLEPEVESLQKVLKNKNFADDENIKKRLDFLTGQTNHLVFTEGVVQSTPVFQETTETLVHPVEMNIQDIKKVLAKIEGVPLIAEELAPDRPQLLILDFKMEKKKINERNEVFLVNLKLLKREFL